MMLTTSWKCFCTFKVCLSQNVSVHEKIICSSRLAPTPEYTTVLIKTVKLLVNCAFLHRVINNTTRRLSGCHQLNCTEPILWLGCLRIIQSRQNNVFTGSKQMTWLISKKVTSLILCLHVLSPPPSRSPPTHATEIAFSSVYIENTLMLPKTRFHLLPGFYLFYSFDVFPLLSNLLKKDTRTRDICRPGHWFWRLHFFLSPKVFCLCSFSLEADLH